MDEQQQNRQQPQRNKQIVFIIGVYLVFTMFSHITTDTVAFNKNIINIINNPDNKDLQVQSIMSVFTAENYVGFWKTKGLQTLNVLNNGDGKFKAKFQKFQNNGNGEYQFQVQINNGVYIDNGDVLIRVMVPANMLQIYRQDKSVIIDFNFTQINGTKPQQKAYYLHSRIFKTIDQRVITLSNLSLTLTPTQTPPNLSPTLTLQSPQLFSVSLTIQKQQSTMLSTILFAAILFIISYMQFSAVIQILRSMFEGREFAQSYSMITILVATMWDAVVCVIAFIQAFGNEESLILFIIPAFLLCLLFTNLELRVLLMIFQARSENRNIREVICKFNLITYGGLLLMYPLLKITNLSSFFFLSISLLIFPQIFHNAQRGQRPNLSNPYYSKFLTFRFLLILYLKCFPWNVFDLEPNYILSFSTIAILAFQIFLLWVQKNYGPKKVVPKFMLPPVFNYEGFLDGNIEEGSDLDCAICLASLNTDPEPGGSSDPNVPYKIMRGPCGHKFHGACLAQWMRIKMQCPQCRGKLPPFQ